jgi:hypothetical protein
MNKQLNHQQFEHLSERLLLGAGVRCYTAGYHGKPVVFIAVACVRMKAKLLSSKPLSRATRLSRIRRRQTTPKLHSRTLHFPNQNSILHPNK